jgi:methylated-DNA-protein-cysteine methyltransferase-like protein
MAATRRRSSLPPAPFVAAVSATIRTLRRGQVASYSQVAARAGYPGAARAVGNVLATTLGLPWWRVVRADGQLAAHSRVEQARRLRREGIRLNGTQVTMPRRGDHS